MIVIQIVIALLYALLAECNYGLAPKATYRYTIEFKTKTSADIPEFEITNRKLELIKEGI